VKEKKKNKWKNASDTGKVPREVIREKTCWAQFRNSNGTQVAGTRVRIKVKRDDLGEVKDWDHIEEKNELCSLLEMLLLVFSRGELMWFMLLNIYFDCYVKYGSRNNLRGLLELSQKKKKERDWLCDLKVTQESLDKEALWSWRIVGWGKVGK
jgi:hypothetical protein